MCYETEKDCNAENRPFPDILKTGQIGGGNVALYSCSPCLGTGRFFDTSLIKRNIGGFLPRAQDKEHAGLARVCTDGLFKNGNHYGQEIKPQGTSRPLGGVALKNIE